MPVPEERLYHPERLNRWFALASVLMTGSFLWMSYEDYARPWRDYQDDFYLSKAALAHLDYLDAIREDRKHELEEARKELERQRELAATAHAEERARLETKLAEADLAFRKVNGPYSRASQVLEVTRDTYEKALGKYGPEHPDTEAAHEQVLAEEREVERLQKEKEHWEDTRDQLEDELRELERPVREARKRVRELEKVAADALEKDQDYRGVLTDRGPLSGVPVVSALINAPFLDFTAPKNTPGRHQINQLVLPDVRQRLNYLETYTTDRCTTCHVAIDDPEFSQERLAQKLERSLPGINEALQRRSADAPPDEERLTSVPIPAPPSGPDGATLPTGRVTEFWELLTREQQNAYFEALLSSVNLYLAETGRKQLELGQPLLAHPNLELYVTVDSAHPKQKMGCTVCHEGNPQETDFVLAAHSPPTHEVEEHWKEKYYDTVLGVPTMTFATVEHYWDRPMRLPKYTEGSCAKCHEHITDIARFQGEREGARINLGEHLFVTVGCINCHNVDEIADAQPLAADGSGQRLEPRRVGPDLTNVASKLTPEFVQQWAYFPQRFRPSTRMPHFFLQENNDADSANSFDTDPVTRTQTEVAAMTRYLFAVSADWEPLPVPEGVDGDAERGRALFEKIGCLACHGNTAEYGEEWITNDLVHRQGIDEETATFRYKGMTPEERVRYAMAHFSSERDTFLKPDAVRFDPEQEYDKPIFSRFAPELSAIGSKVTYDWLYSWLLEPTHYAPNTKMPNLRLSPEEAADLAAYLMTLKDDTFEQFEFEIAGARREMLDDIMFTRLSAQRSERRSRAIMADEGGALTEMLVSLLSASLGEGRAYETIRSMSLQGKKLMYVGNRSISHYGCYACHTIAGFEAAAPPGTDMSGWAEKPVTQLDFAFYDHAFDKMRDGKDEIFGHLYRKEDTRLKHLSPVEDDTREQITVTHAAFAKHKMLNPRIWDREKIKRPYEKLKMPNYYFTEEEAEALTTYLLSRLPARVNENLRVDYEGTPAGPIARGRKLTRELNCVACHQIENNYPLIQQYFRREIAGRLVTDVINAPPILRGEGAKLQHNWFHQFLQHVEPLRPWLIVRMPSFNYRPEEQTTLVEYFAALAQQDAADLTERLARVEEYQDRKASSVEEEEGSDDLSPGADWYAQESLDLVTEALQRFGIERELIRPREIDALTNSPEELAEAHAVLLDRARFLRSLYDVEYPFVEPPAPLSDQERFDRGLNFLVDMGCLQCHVLGDMLPGPAATTDDFVQMYRLDGVRGEGESATVILNGEPYPVGTQIDGFTIVSGSNTYYDGGDVDTQAVIEGLNADGETERVMLTAASAPNLSLTYKRLRRDWVHAWMSEPGLIQPGTKMPQNFAGGVSPYEGDPSYPGTSADHINLLVDVLYDAGQKNVRIPLDKIVVSDEVEEFEEDGGESEFFEE